MVLKDFSKGRWIPVKLQINAELIPADPKIICVHCSIQQRGLIISSRSYDFPYDLENQYHTLISPLVWTPSQFVKANSWCIMDSSDVTAKSLCKW